MQSFSASRGLPGDRPLVHLNTGLRSDTPPFTVANQGKEPGLGTPRGARPPMKQRQSPSMLYPTGGGPLLTHTDPSQHTPITTPALTTSPTGERERGGGRERKRERESRREREQEREILHLPIFTWGTAERHRQTTILPSYWLIICYEEENWSNASEQIRLYRISHFTFIPEELKKESSKCPLQLLTIWPATSLIMFVDFGVLHLLYQSKSFERKICVI